MGGIDSVLSKLEGEEGAMLLACGLSNNRCESMEDLGGEEVLKSGKERVLTDDGVQSCFFL